MSYISTLFLLFDGVVILIYIYVNIFMNNIVINIYVFNTYNQYIYKFWIIIYFKNFRKILIFLNIILEYEGNQRNNFRAKAKENDRGAGAGEGEGVKKL